MEGLVLNNVSPDHADLQKLICLLDQDLLQRYPQEEIFGLDFSDENISDVSFLVAYLYGIPVGCGAIKPYDKHSTELKRFFVEEPYRNKGIARELLSELEMRAKSMNFRSMKLEAGEAQPEALGFYRKHGYEAIDRFGPYQDNESSVCLEKQL
ncbi:GNAT family N-acetyltransferase [Paenibacillus sp. 2TAB23]|uniref:GNAT family N-acetyltransferase n=1 Tax=Paenibacillus sp. 2TAB23 TaxID=3233004 RepID=UPI003F98DD71